MVSAYVNNDNNQFIQPNVNSTTQANFKKQSGGATGYGSTMQSLASSTVAGNSRPFTSKYSHCSGQKGGAANFENASSYGFTKEGSTLANNLRGSYAPISPNMKINQCGGKRRRRKSRRKNKSRKSRRKNKSRKSRRKRQRGGRRKPRRKSRRKRQRGGSCGCAGTIKGGRRKTRRNKRRSRRQKGGRYQQYGSNIPSSAGYSMPNPSSSPWSTGPGSFSRYQNCK